MTEPTESAAAMQRQTESEQKSLALWLEIPKHPLVVLPMLSMFMASGAMGFVIGGSIPGLVRFPLLFLGLFIVLASFVAGTILGPMGNRYPAPRISHDGTKRRMARK